MKRELVPLNRIPNGMLTSASYLEGFCESGTRHLAFYDCGNDRFHVHQRIDTIESIESSSACDSEMENPEIEKAFFGIEAEAIPVIRKIDMHEEISPDERYALALYAAMQHTLTSTYEKATDRVTSNLLTDFVREAFSSEEAIAKTMTIGRRSGLGPTKMVELIKLMNFEVDRREQYLETLDAIFDVAKILYGQDWLIVRRPDEKTAFITTDSPFCLLQGDRLPVPLHPEIDLTTPGVQKALPLSQSSVLITSDPGYGLQDLVLNRNQVHVINKAIALNCRNYVFGCDQVQIESIVKTARINERWETQLQIH